MAAKRGHHGKQLGLYVSDEIAEKLKTLAKKTDLPQSHLLREGLQLLFDKYAATLNPKAGKARKQPM